MNEGRHPHAREMGIGVMDKPRGHIYLKYGVMLSIIVSLIPFVRDCRPRGHDLAYLQFMLRLVLFLRRFLRKACFDFQPNKVSFHSQISLRDAVSWLEFESRV